MDSDDSRGFFAENYVVLSGNSSSYSWQGELFQRFCEEDYPTEIDLPTGTGKTSLMDIWFLALAYQATKDQVTIPRRLVWVVNRRVVVDQATERAIKIAENTRNLSPDCKKALSSLSVTGCVEPAISTLRGEKADNREWTRDPSRPAIVIGTVDMIGSRLLFSGYGDGCYFRPQHAGLLGVDTLVVNDEAHLTPAFVHLLAGIKQRQAAKQIPGRTFRYMSLSATQTGQAKNRFPHSLERDMAEHETFRTRITGDKRLFLHEVADSKKLESLMFDLAIQPGAARTIVYVEQPEKALAVFRRLKKVHPERVELLTGTMRGYERDQLLKTPVLQAMLLQQPPTEQTWLVATSAGEVGIDMTSERQVSTLVSADHLIQRFGRLNRYGSSQGEAHVVHTQPKEKETTLVDTLHYLQHLNELGDGRDIRCLNLRENPPSPGAQTAIPKFAELENWLIDLWCQTSDPVSGYPRVESWLHGLEDAPLPETEIAWRADVEELTRDGVSDRDRKTALRFHRVLAHEKLREPTGRLTDKLKKLAEKAPTSRVLIQGKDRSLAICELKDIDQARLDYALVLAQPSLGALIHGMLSADPSDGSHMPNDVADETGTHHRERWLGVRNDEGTYRFTRLGGSEQVEVLEHLEESLADFAENRGMRIALQIASVTPEDSEDPDRVLVYLRELPKTRSTSQPIYLGSHCQDVSSVASSLAERLIPDLAALYQECGLLHDAGKARDLWQRVMGNRDPAVKVAKPIGFVKGGNALGGYRHELGSLLEARRHGATTRENGERDLLLHLIASHHGHARPHYPKDAHDAESLAESEEAMIESVARFGRLADEWGPWGLAYLEAIFKAADGIASSLADDGRAAVEQPDDEHD